MARCQCGAELTGRRRKCDACKGRSTVAREVAAKDPARKTAAKKPAPAKTRPAKKAAAKRSARKTTPPVQPAPAGDFPDGLHSRGRSLWKALGQKLDTPAGQIALEACRAADRLDELDSIIAGKGVLNLLSFRLNLGLEDMVSDETHIRVTVGFQNVLAEARQQQANFKVLLAEISDIVPAAPAAPASAGPAKSPLDELAARRAGK